MNEPYILDTFPLLIPSKNFKYWKGDILLNMHSIYIEIYCPNIPKLDNLEVCIPGLNTFNSHKFDLYETVEIIKKKTHTLSEFLIDLISDLGKVWKQDLFSNQQNFRHIYNNEKFYAVIQEVNLYSQFVHTIDDNLKHIKFNVLDKCKRNHFITVYIPDEYPIVAKQGLYFETIVPSVIMNSLLRINTISKLLETFKNYVNDLNDFWDVHEEIITTCNAIGSYTYEDVNYKIPIDHHVYVNVEVDPVNSKSCPKFNFHGQSETIGKFQLRLNQINPILNWNTENSFKDNILDIFEINAIQSQYEEDIQEQNIECLNNYCFICYDELDTVMKNQIKICNNEKCDAVYHMTCICVWLQNSGSMPMFEHLQGQCPQCETEMLVALENFDLNKA